MASRASIQKSGLMVRILAISAARLLAPRFQPGIEVVQTIDDAPLKAAVRRPLPSRAPVVEGLPGEIEVLRGLVGRQAPARKVEYGRCHGG